uniref:phenylalanine--tRNA ligase n=1 Tax=Neotessella volvocina TaxID=52559 RepID=A0A3G2QZX2_9STRA|nr:phenylalanyl tRNA synthetase beta subunit [Neotessella volvocina]
MEFSLLELKKTHFFNSLTLKNLINLLNTKGLEIDGYSISKLKENDFFENVQLLIKIPSNRQDLFNENSLKKELEILLSLKNFFLWKKLNLQYFLFQNKNQSYSSFILLNPNFLKVQTYLIKIENFEEIKSRLWITKKLENLGIKDNNTINEISNLICSEWGHQLRLQTLELNFSEIKPLIVEQLKKTEFFIDHQKQYHELTAGNLVIKEKNGKIIFVLGKIVPISINTLTNHSLILEASFFEPGLIKEFYTLKDFSLILKRTQKSFLEAFKHSIQRFLSLLEIFSYCSYSSLYLTTKTTKNFSHRILSLRKNYLLTLLNLKNYDLNIFKQADLRIICETKKNFYILIPSIRYDLTREIDLVEEYSRFLEYESFLEIFPMKEKKQKAESKPIITYLKQYFLNYSFNEVLNNSIQQNEKEHITNIFISNPLNKELDGLRSSLLPKLIDLYSKNTKISYGIKKNLFETGRVFQNYKGKFIEEDKFSAIFEYPFSKNKEKNISDWFIVKGFIENILHYFGYKDLVIETIPLSFSFFHPNRSILFKKNEKILLLFGELSPTYQVLYNFKNPVYLFELNLIYFQNFQLRTNVRQYQIYSKYPSIKKDLSILASKKTNFSLIKEIIFQLSFYIKNLEFFDIYIENKNFELIKIGLRIEFQSQKQTLTNEIIQNELQLIKNFFEKNFKSKFHLIIN